MQFEAMNQALTDAFPNDTARLEGDGYKFEATVISAQFVGKRTLARHKLVYAALEAFIKSGELHALTIVAKTPEEAGDA
ncbi:MAG: BolA/IbaG family iron-sulfur metabolism protein [Pseudomonadota bacterium]